MAKMLNFPNDHPRNNVKMKFTVDMRFKGIAARHFSFFKDYSELEDYLLDSEVTIVRKLKARLLGKAYLGEFKLANSTEFLEYYLMWCPIHSKYDASYLHSEDRSLVCRDCEKERMRRIWQNDEEIGDDEELF